MRCRPLTLLLCTLTSLAWGCSDDEEWARPLPAPDAALFVDEVYPMLLRDCAFPVCHGAPERFLRIVGPGRARLELDTAIEDPVSLAEIRHSYDRARSVLATDENLAESLLLSKPLEVAAGGQGHEGTDDFGRNLFRTRDDPRYELLGRWAQTRGSEPTDTQVSHARDAITTALEVMEGSSP